MKNFIVVAIVLLALFGPLFTATTLHAQQAPATEQTANAPSNASLRSKTLINNQNSRMIMSSITGLMVVLLIGSIVYMSRGSKSDGEGGYTKS